jgi:hypothetical protein
MSLKALGAAMRGMAHGHLGLRPSGGPLGLPADFLIAPSGRINAVKYAAPGSSCHSPCDRESR